MPENTTPEPTTINYLRRALLRAAAQMAQPWCGLDADRRVVSAIES